MTQLFLEIPLSPRTQRCSVTVLNKTYQLALIWRDAISKWILDIADTSGTPILSGIPLVTGSDLLGQFKHLGIGAGLMVMLDNGADDQITYDNLGSTAHLRFVVNA